MVKFFATLKIIKNLTKQNHEDDFPKLTPFKGWLELKFSKNPAVGAPLSLLNMMIVFSRIPLSLSDSTIFPTLSSSFEIMAAKIVYIILLKLN